MEETKPVPSPAVRADSMQRLLPCPFCGGAAFTLARTCDKTTPYRDGDRAFPVARCRSCGAEANGENWGEPSTAIAAWNRRASAPPAPEAPDSSAHSPATVEGLPSLPEAKGVIRCGAEDSDGWIVDFDCEGPLSHTAEEGEELFTADQMREYGLAAAALANTTGSQQ